MSSIVGSRFLLGAAAVVGSHFLLNASGVIPGVVQRLFSSKIAKEGGLIYYAGTQGALSMLSTYLLPCSYLARLGISVISGLSGAVGGVLCAENVRLKRFPKMAEWQKFIFSKISGM